LPGYERGITNRIKKALNKEFPKSVWYKIHGSPHQEKGIPDLIGCYKGKFFALEVKVPGKEDNTTKYQEYQLKRVKEAGGTSSVVSSPQQAINLIKKFL